MVNISFQSNAFLSKKASLQFSTACILNKFNLNFLQYFSVQEDQEIDGNSNIQNWHLFPEIFGAIQAII